MGGSAVLSLAQLQHISTYIDILLRWNARINLTAIRDPEDIVTRHFGESLFAARHLFPSGQAFPDGTAVPSGTAPPAGGAAGGGAAAGTSAAGGIAAVGDNAAARASAARGSAPAGDRAAAGGSAAAAGGAAPGGRAALQGRVRGQEKSGALAPEVHIVADIGSGAGFPGLPIKLWAPHIALTLIESNHKKAAFLREITRALTLTDVNIQITRAETLARATFDTVTLRAVERFESILPTAAALVAPSGRFALLISSAQKDQACSTLPGFSWSAPNPIPYSRSRILLVGDQR
jgi:16S rRNA G527 N7-methylase RsmG